MLFVTVWHFNGKRQEREAVWAQGTSEVRIDLDRLPVPVYIDKAFGDAHEKSIRMAIGDMNDVGCQLMVVVADIGDADVHFINEGCDYNSSSEPNHPGCTWFDAPRGLSVVQIGQPGNVTTSYLIAFHEATHVFGLAHDGVYRVPEEAEDSLMFVPITANNAPEHAYRMYHGKLLPGLSDKDSEALQNRYCSTTRG